MNVCFEILNYNRGLISKNKFKSNVFIYGDKVAFISVVNEPVGIIIQNKLIADTQKQVFEVLWNAAER